MRTRHFQAWNYKTIKIKCLKNTAFKQKTFQIVKEHTARSAPRDHSNSCSYLSMSSSHRALAWAGKAAVGTAREHELVEPAGIEPATFWLQTRRSPS